MKGPPSHWTTLKKLIYLKAARGSGPSWLWQLLTGTAPLTLLNAVAHPIHSLTQYGLCVQDGTPTPYAPVPILCNNGEIKVSRNLCDVVSANIVVGKYINNSGVESSDTANFYYATYIPVSPGETYTMSTSSSIWYFSVMQYDSSKNFLRRTIWGATNTPVGTEKTFSVGADCAYILFGSNMRKASISLADVLAVNWMLNIGDTAMDYQPYVEGGIYIGGAHPGQNLVDLTAVTDDYYYDPTGVYTAVANARLTDFIPVKAGQKYTVYVKAETSGTAANVRCNLFDTAKTWKSQSSFTVNSGAEAVSVITPAEDGYLRVSANYTGTGAKVDWSVLQVVRGEYTLATMPPYEPYTEIPYAPEALTVSADGAETQTVTDIPMLLSVDTVKDDWEAVHGPLTHRIGLYVIKGSDDEGWTENTTYSGTFYADCLPSSALITTISLFTRYEGVLGSRSVASMNNGTAKCGSSSNRQRIFIRDTSCADVDALKAKLSGFYAAGDPCIVAFALAEPTTEQTTAHALHTVSGTNVVDVSAAVEGVTVAVEYAKQSA